jgi:hypothetical protein
MKKIGMKKQKNGNKEKKKKRNEEGTFIRFCLLKRAVVTLNVVVQK